MATIYTHAGANIRRTWLLLIIFFVLLIGVFWVFSYAYANPVILYVGVALSLAMNVGSYWFSDKIVLAIAHARPVASTENPELYRVVENLAITAGLPMPRLFLISDPAPHAFSTGRDPKHAVVAVTSGLLERLERAELEGVLAHELSHIGNRDMLIATVVVVLAGVIAIVSDFFFRARMFGGMANDRDNRAGALMMVIAFAAAILAPIAATLIRLAISRRREYLADASGVLLTRYPEGLIAALRKISLDPRPLALASTATAHLFFENPFKADAIGASPRKTSWLVRMFMTHPPIEDRIKALRLMNG